MVMTGMGFALLRETAAGLTGTGELMTPTG